MPVAGVARRERSGFDYWHSKAVSIPVIFKVRIGHTMEARILEALKVDFIDESEVLTPADPFDHVDKREFKVPFVWCNQTWVKH